MVKLKDLLKESFERKFGEPLGTLDSVMKDYQLGKLYTDKDRPPFKTEKQIKEELNEDGHTDVPSSVRKLKTSIEDATEIIGKLQSMSDEQPLPSWWSDKITLSANYLNKARDYILNPNESVNERSNPSDKKELLRALKNSKVADAFSLNKDELVIEMTSPSGTNFVVGNIRKYKGD